MTKRKSYTFTVAITVLSPDFMGAEYAIDYMYQKGVEATKKQCPKTKIDAVIHWIDKGRKSTAIKARLK